MSALARWYHHSGCRVSGYDRTPSPVTKALEEEGIPVHFEDNASLLPPTPEDTLVIYTPAVPAEMGELTYARSRGYRTVKRSEALEEITDGHRCLAVAGTHGKTSTSTMLAHILTVSGECCTAFLGGISRNYGSNLLLSDSGVMVAEADEFDRSFLRLHPEGAVVTAMDADHMDIYRDIDDLRGAFVQFGRQCSDTLVVKKGLEEYFRRGDVRARIWTYGEGGDFSASDIISDGQGKMYFTLNTPEGRIERCQAGVPGKVYIENATAAAAGSGPPLRHPPQRTRTHLHRRLRPSSRRTGRHHCIHPPGMARKEDLRHLPASPLYPHPGFPPGVRREPEPAGLTAAAAHIPRPGGASARSVLQPHL